MNPDIRIVVAGEQALQIEFKNEISIENSSRVTQLHAVLDGMSIPGVIEIIQAYRTLMLHYRPEVIRYSELKAQVESVLEDISFETQKKDLVFVTEIPVLYGGEWGPDLEEVAEKERMTTEEVIRRHSTNPNYLYFVGFSPGMPYLGNPNRTFSVPRRPSPRLHLLRGAVTIWQNQTTVFPVDDPGGWNVIGRTPLRLFDPHREPAILLESGQWVQFRPIDRAEYDEIDRQIEAGTYQVKTYWKEQPK